MIENFKYTEAELKKILSSMTIICDSREQQCSHITEWFDKKKISYVSKKLDWGDYSFYIPKNPELGIIRDTYFNNQISIERKGCLDEIIENFVERDRLESEFLRHKGKMYLIIEDSTYDDMYEGKYQSKYASKSAIGTLHSMTDRYGLNFIFLNKEYTAKFIFCTFYYHLRNQLK